MSVQEIEKAITELQGEELSQLISWFEEYQADLWDKQIEADASAGLLKSLADTAKADYETGRCRPL
jgi:hypothetical protein